MDIEFEADGEISVKDWILETFKRRECVKYVRYSEIDENCGCGRSIEEHQYLEVQEIIETKKDIWLIQSHTMLYPTNAFGTIEFQGADTPTTKAEYIRLSFDTKPQHIIKLFKQYWQLELPKLIISVHGGIANFGLQQKLKQAIEKGLVKVANTSKIWIITAGTDTGVVKHIGDIIRKNYPKFHHNIVAIGIAPFGVVSGRELLIGEGSETAYYKGQFTSGANCADLNYSHTYFLLVDDGTVGKHGCEIVFRRRLERYLSKYKSFETLKPGLYLHNNYGIPSVSLIIEGGANTIKTVLLNSQSTPPIPVVVCDGSGRAADLLSFTHKYSYCIGKDKVTMEIEIKEQLISAIMQTFVCNKSDAEHIFIEMMNTVKNKEMISIYRVGIDEDDIDVAILTSSLKISNMQLSRQLDLTMSWNRPDIAKKCIKLFGTEAEKRILQDKMFDALSHDKVEFVKLLLEYGVNLQKFLTFKRLQDLYNYQYGSSVLELIVKGFQKKMNTNTYLTTLIDIGQLVEELMGSGYVSEYSRREFRLKYAKFLNKNYQEDYFFKCPYNELLIWAVLMKRHKMAKFVCVHHEETLAKALVACKLNKAMAREAEFNDFDSEIVDDFKKYSEEFATLACCLLDRCYKEDDKLTSQLLTYDLVNWSHWTCLTLAFSCSLRDFLSHTSCQNLITDLWMGGMKIRKYTTLKVIAALLFPPAIFAIKFKSIKELQYMPQTQEEHEQDLQTDRQLTSPSAPHSSLSSSIDLDNIDLSEIDPDDKRTCNLHAICNAYENRAYIDDSKLNDMSDEHTKKVNRKLTRSNISLTSKCSINRMSLPDQIQHKRNQLKLGKKFYEFYNSPITKFWQDTLCYIAFLISLTYVVIVKLPKHPSIVEIFVLTYVFSHGLDKIRDLLQTDTPRFSGKLRVFFSKIMNTMDCLFIFTMMLALILRVIEDERSLIIAHLIYCCNATYWYIKLLEYFIMSKHVGPFIIMVSRMLIDLSKFIIVILIILTSFGVCRQAIKYPNEEFKWKNVKQIFLEPYYMLYGEVYAEKIDPECTAAGLLNGDPGCMPGHWITPLMQSIFFIISDTLLLSILIASFNTTFSRISGQSAKVWKSERYQIVTKYEGKPLLAPPFVLLCHIYMIIKYFIRLYKGKTLKFDRKLKAFLTNEMIEHLHEFEENSFYEYSNDLVESKEENMEERVKQTKDKVENITTRIDDLCFKENMTKLSLYKIELKLHKLEEYSSDIVRQVKNTKQNSNSKQPQIVVHQAVDNVDELSPHIKENLISKSSNSIRSAAQSIYSNNADEPYMSKYHLNPSIPDINCNNNETDNKDDESMQNLKLHKTNPIFLINDDNNEISSEKEANEFRKITTIKPITAYPNSDRSQVSFDQYTLHPFVYLQPVTKPILTEYTSITDYIDTSKVDRTPSPMSNVLTSSSSALNNNSNINDYCTKESMKSAIAHHENEMSRRVNESQYLISNEFKNKILKPSNFVLYSNNKETTDSKDVDESLNSTCVLNNTSTVLSDQLTSSKDNNENAGIITKTETSTLENSIQRTPSQIWFARTEPEVLCLDLEEEEDET